MMTRDNPSPARAAGGFLPYHGKVKMMDVMISIPDQVADKLRERASASGQPIGDYTARIVEQAVQGPTLEELLDPVQADFARSGMTEDQLLDLGRSLLDQVRSENKVTILNPKQLTDALKLMHPRPE